MKRIGLVGFFGWGNFGDELFVEVYKRYLGPYFEVSVVHDLLKKPYFSQPIDEVVDRYDAFVIGGGDLIIPWQLSGLYWRPEFLRKPTIVNSVGVPTWGGYDRSVVLKLREFVNHPSIQYISARDQESARWINKHLKVKGEALVAPDMVCALDFPPTNRADPPILGVVTRFRGKDREDYSQLAVLCEKAVASGYRIKHIVLGSHSTGERDLEAARAFDFSGKETFQSEDVWEQCRAIGECSVLASMKFHGSVVAAMYGIPSIVLSPTDKSRNFMRQIERPELLSNLNDQQLHEHFSPFMASIPMRTREQLRSGARASLEFLKQRLYSTCENGTLTSKGNVSA